MVFLAGCGAPATQAPAEQEPQQAMANTPTRLPDTPAATATSPETPVSAPILFTPTPRATATETLLPTLELPTLALNPPALAVWDGVPTYLADSEPGYYFRVQYDPEKWALVTDQLGQPALSHRTIPYCVITPTAGRGLPPNVRVEHENIYPNDLSIDMGKAYEGDILRFVTYQVSDGTVFTGFEVGFQEQSESCLDDALAVIETLRPVPSSQATPQP
jgi:hypothetical protein